MTLYTLSSSPPADLAAPLGHQPVVIAVDRVRLPDDLDSEDIVVRHNSVLEASHSGRWASRLSLGATNLVTAKLAQRLPNALVTDDPQAGAPSYRIQINISLLDLSVQTGASTGSATLQADWLIIPGNSDAPVQRDRTRIVMTGPMENDREVVALTQALLEQLAARIDISRWH